MKAMLIGLLPLIFIIIWTYIFIAIPAAMQIREWEKKRRNK